MLLSCYGVWDWLIRQDKTLEHLLQCHNMVVMQAGEPHTKNSTLYLPVLNLVCPQTVSHIQVISVFSRVHAN